ncbi:MAG: hypothetical protein KAH48_07535, partial [Chlorobi bacterium]|nr:hypothetical protein [Chlorobiota bacterium]
IEDNKDLAANYKVFLAEGQAAAADADKFKLVADFPGSDVELGESEPGGRSFASYLLNLRLEKLGPYSLYMIAYNEEDESKMSNIAYFVNDDINIGHLRISSMPEETASVGDEYTYQPVTEYKNKIVESASYKLDNGPEGMAFTKSGLLRWMPEESGNFHVLITSSAEIDGKEMICFQEFVIRVRACSEPTFISGTVIQENSDPADGHIMIVTTDFLDGNQDTVRSDEEGNAQYYSGIVKGGQYRVAVDKGEFLVFFQSNQQTPNMPESRGEWYENADNPEDAKVVTVDCGDNKLVNMIVDDIVEINMVKVSGTVKYEGESTDPDGTKPSAYVEFFPISDNGSGGNFGKMHAFVGRDGYYEIELPDMYDYKAAAYLYNAEDMNSGFV